MQRSTSPPSSDRRDGDLGKNANPRAGDSREFFNVPGRELEDLLHPVTPQQFVERYWTREALRFARHAAVDFPLRNIVSGSEGYRIYRFPHDGPTRLWERFDEPDEASFSEVVLEPGDLLCLPAGAWHSAKAIGHSLAINLAFNPMLFDAFITAALRERLLAIPEWRCPIPLSPGRQADGTVPDHVAAFFAARLREMKDCIEALTADGPELTHTWREHIYSRTQSASDVARALPSDSRPIRSSDRFVCNPFTSFGWSLDEAFKPALTIYEGMRSHSIRLPERMQPLVRTIMTVHSFCAEDCMRWANEGSPYEWSAVEATLRALLNGGVIRREDSKSGGPPVQTI